MRGKETKLVYACIDYLKGIGVSAWRVNTGGVKKADGKFLKYNVKGTPDIFGIIPVTGRFLCVEVKIWPNKITKDQRAWLVRAKTLGAKAIVVYSMDEMIEQLGPNGEGWNT